jgi:hypothetical protein
MKVSVPAAYSRAGSGPPEALQALLSPETIPEPEPELRPVLPLLPAAWWQSFLHGSSEVLVGGEDAQRALDLIAYKLGKQLKRLEIEGTIRSSQLRKKLYAEFGADLALCTMQALWLEASSNGELPSVPTAPEMSETLAKFFAPDEPAPPWRLESVGDSAERRLRESIGGWCG